MGFLYTVKERYLVIAEGDGLVSVASAKALRSKMAEAAQKVYDDWELDEHGQHWEVGVGGICHLIADKLMDVLDTLKGFNGTTVSSNFEQHVYVVGQFREGVYSIDIHHSVYETGGGYSWKKIPDIKFDPTDVTFDKLSSDPQDFKDYCDACF